MIFKKPLTECTTKLQIRKYSEKKPNHPFELK